MYRVTRALAVGPFLTPDRVPAAHRLGITHIFNVSNSSPQHDPSQFQGSAWEALSDAERIPDHRLTVILTSLHHMAAQPGANVYVHCIAGQLRSPTVLWLYLSALGLSPDEARDWIETASPDAVPGHPRLADGNTLTFAQKFGAAFLTPVPRIELLQRT
jgi:hypothetical protein